MPKCRWQIRFTFTFVFSCKINDVSFITGFSENSVESFLLPQAKSANLIAGNHKPRFDDCQSYKPSVKEEQRANTFVTTVSKIANSIFCS